MFVLGWAVIESWGLVDAATSSLTKEPVVRVGILTDPKWSLPQEPLLVWLGLPEGDG